MVRGTVVLEASRSLDEGEDSRAGFDIADGGPQGKRVVDLCAQYVSGSLVSSAGEEEVVDRLRRTPGGATSSNNIRHLGPVAVWCARNWSVRELALSNAPTCSSGTSSVDHTHDLGVEL